MRVSLESFPGATFACLRLAAGTWNGYPVPIMSRAQVRALEAVTGEDDAYWATPIQEAFRADAYAVDGLAWAIVPEPPSHAIPLGAPVIVTRDGVRQSWRVTVFRHDRNGAYRLAFPDGTYVTAYPSELAVIGGAE